MYRFANVSFFVGDRVSFTYHKPGHAPNRRGVVEKLKGNVLTIKDETERNAFRSFHINRIGNFRLA